MKQRVEIQQKLDKHSRATSPLSAVPNDPGLREAHWVEPKLVAEVSFIEWTPMERFDIHHFRSCV